MVDLAGDAVGAQLGVKHEGHVQHCSVLGQGECLALGGEHDNLTGKQVELDGVQKVERVGLGVLQDVLDGLQPSGQFALLLALANLVLPVGGKAAFGDVVHVAAAYLHLHPVAIRTHHGDVQSTVAVGFRRADPVAHTVGVQAVQVGNLAVDVPADALLLGLVLALKHDACCIQVIHLLKRDALGLHLLPDAVARLDAGTELIVQPHAVQALADGGREASEQLVALGLADGQLLLDAGVGLGVLVLEAQVLKLGLDGKQAQTVSQRCVDIEGLAGNLVLLLRWHRLQRAHVVQAVGHLDQHHADVVAHRQQQLAEVLGLD